MTQKTQIAILGGLILLAALVWYLNSTKPAPAAATTSTFQNYQLLAVENPQLHRSLMETAQKAEYHSLGRNPFSAVAAPPQARSNVAKVHAPIGPVVPPPPPPPMLPGNMKFFGYGTVPNGTVRLAFLSDGEEVYIVPEGDTLLGRYRILKVNNTTLEFEEIATGQRNTVALVPDDQGVAPS